MIIDSASNPFRLYFYTGKKSWCHGQLLQALSTPMFMNSPCSLPAQYNYFHSLILPQSATEKNIPQRLPCAGDWVGRKGRKLQSWVGFCKLNTQVHHYSICRHIGRRAYSVCILPRHVRHTLRADIQDMSSTLSHTHNHIQYQIIYSISVPSHFCAFLKI